ncbi:MULTISPECIES: aldo/keto reductase [Sphingopyxis]|uniref:aldo/keto reductase n=1 Tax=Sphingopyxis TaxID=165697 RepID=UPI000CDF365B|nr:MULTISPECIES: aldo/keto reductase [Sphingopyxis]AVA14920.1 pyridoxal 4-dehydrogenase [Sphingopyxis sp. MG]QUM73191.1 aldo/keto reductase [Sphingopyxis granuli]
MVAAVVESLPRLGLGCASLGNLYRAITRDQALAIVDAAWDAGWRYFDTAPYYGLGLSERRLGDALRERERADYTISSKVGRLLDPDTATDIAAERHGFVTAMPFKVRYDYSYDGVMRSYEASLQRLGLARVDILLVHDIGIATHGSDNERHLADLWDGGYRALDELRGSGAISAIGLGVNEWQACADAMEKGRWDCFLLAGRYTLLEQEPLHDFLPQCEAHGAKIILGGAYNSGILATGTRRGGELHYNYAPAPQSVIDRVVRIEEICDAHGVTLAAAALQFPLAHSVVQSVIPGLGEARRLRQTERLMSQAIPSAFWQQLKREGLLDLEAPVPVGRD